jgi:hypothetical protein
MPQWAMERWDAVTALVKEYLQTAFSKCFLRRRWN